VLIYLVMDEIIRVAGQDFGISKTVVYADDVFT
jgi:hypothetical protein